ncbi:MULTISPECIES: tyrosine-type recombinase/integrase [Catenuloplanes]|uniref:Integrase n=1 Tax=Catenuloplanes niger TaxID=587534 RepID=A0AAE3ZQ05_9ACTN|nr:tyrosine-type recombinase/integrase [Catenuloplanes niger]MDR7322148.1 integrase [Catenuloplanes niger]
MAKLETRRSKDGKSGSYRVSWLFGGSRGGKTQTCTFTGLDKGALSLANTAKELAEARRHRITSDEVYASVLGERKKVSSTPLVRDWFEEWIGSRVRLSPRERRNYRSKFERRIAPLIGHLPVDQVTFVEIGKIINDLRVPPVSSGHKPLANTSVTRYYSVVFSLFKAAVARGHITVNPCLESGFVRNETDHDDEGTEHRFYLTEDQYQVLLSAFKPEDRIVIELLVGTGGRYSEVTALAVEDILAPTATEGPRIRFRRAWKESREKKGSWYLGPPKSRQRRTVGISMNLYEQLVDYVQGLPPEAFVVRARRGGPMRYQNWHTHIWKPAVLNARRCGLHPPPNQETRMEGSSGRCGDYGGIGAYSGKPCNLSVVPGYNRCGRHFGPRADAVSTCGCPGVLPRNLNEHDLRHSHAGFLFANPTVTVNAISRRLGHGSIRTTVDIYGGLLPKAEQAAIDAITAATRSKPGRPTAVKPLSLPKTTSREVVLAAARSVADKDGRVARKDLTAKIGDRLTKTTLAYTLTALVKSEALLREQRNRYRLPTAA